MTARKAVKRKAGHLVIIGGAEDREGDKPILARVVELARRRKPTVTVLTAASTQPEELWAVYDRAFADLGAGQRVWFDLPTREAANEPQVAQAIFDADVVFMTGGDQKRLLSVVGGTPVDSALQAGLRERALCVAGTSAGASAMSDYMPATASNDALPSRDMVTLAAGLGLLQRVVIDQHFSERQRLGRLLSVIAQNPALLGVGIDEDTALVIEPAACVEVIGEGAVTLVDGSRMRCNYLEVRRREALQLENVALHLLPSGTHFDAPPPSDDAAAGDALAGLAKAVAMLTTVPAVAR
jgi:cyanophycinase